MISDEIKCKLYRLNNLTVTRVSIDQWAVELIVGEFALYVESEWVLLTNGNEVVDKYLDLASRGNFNLWQLLGKQISDVDLVDGELSNLKLTFSNESQFIAYANDDDFEDWSVTGPSLNITCMRKI